MAGMIAFSRPEALPKKELTDPIRIGQLLFDQVLETRCQNVDTQGIGAAQMLYFSGLLDVAKKILNLAIETSNDKRALALLGICYMDEDNHKSAFPLLEDFYNSQPDLGNSGVQYLAWMYSALLYRMNSEFDKSFFCTMKAAKLPGKVDGAKRELAKFRVDEQGHYTYVDT